MATTEGVETWRGGVNAWECDGNGHLNVRFHVARAQEGLVGLARRLGKPRAFAADATATLKVVRHHVRFLKEARAGDNLHMTCGVVAMGECDAEVLQVLVHSASDEPCASFLTRLAHATPLDGRAFPWPARAREAAAGLGVEVPAFAAPRGLGGDTPDDAGMAEASVARAEALGLQTIAAGAVTAQACDVFGRMGAEEVMGRLSDGVGHLMAGVRTAIREATGLRNVGGAALEYRLAYADLPRAGDQLVVRSALAAVEPRVQRLAHWVLDPVTGRPWAAALAVVTSFDLDTRKAITLPPEVAEFLRERVVEGLG